MSTTSVDLIKQKIDIIDFIGQYVNLKPAGSNYKALCPFHQEKTPSFFVSPERQFFKCFGCGQSGDVFTFLMKIEGVTFPEALKILADKAGVKLDTTYRSAQSENIKTKLYHINKQAAFFYHYLLTKHTIGQTARQYLDKRRLKPSTIKTFHLGYAPDNWDSLTKFLTKKNIDLDLAVKAGLLVKSKNRFYDRFRGRIIFPLFNILGEIVGFGGRVISQTKDIPKYINTPETPIYHKSRHLFGLYQTKLDIKQQRKVIITEGEFDLLSSYQAGIRHIVAVKGSALTKPHLKILKRYADQIIFCFDQDSAGLQATQKSLLLAENHDLKTAVINLPSGKDPDDLIKDQPKTWASIAAHPDQGFAYLLSVWQKQTSPSSPYATKDLLNKVFNFLIQLNDVILKNQYLLLTAQTLNLDPALIKDSFQQYQSKKTTIQFQPASAKAPAAKVKDNILPEAYLLALILKAQDPKLTSFIHPEHFSHPGYKKLAVLILKASSLQTLPSKIPTELSDLFNELFLIPDLDQLIRKGQDKLKAQIQKITDRLHKSFLEKQINALKQIVRQKELADQPTDTETQKLQEYLDQLRGLK
ncbi:MAG: DNA primase [bacterium]|nr:DNA primase [bacterium]